ncbi:helix-turn-helix domain-containing protein [Actinoplanes teichomyceticus]|uniref:XRE family transcriptional regulator n=1 Tax=Actinoplanes teichomyceticus TaxID=1867 RepID=A0A561WPG9_ACTTI|nr:helix-turn-helix domain-containing protein [Actinoplanes teichomyceticus]TWG25733.1 XRE family transcriptional regulator [Actinoplanes teichomyceticus]GIF10809.1 XRE family transcriptional regulator [Actinoplanes teichomyceticus]
MPDDLTEELAATLRAVRTERELTLNALATRSGVSRAMIAKIERGAAQPTAALLGRLAAALGITLSELFSRTEKDSRRLIRRADQAVWIDPETGYRRRSVSPPGGAAQLVEVELPPGASVACPADAFAPARHQIYVLDGRLRFREGDVVHDLDAGDCLELGPPAPGEYHNPAGQPCRYLVILSPGRGLRG